MLRTVARKAHGRIAGFRAGYKDAKQEWNKGLAEEVTFWRAYLASGGEPWPDDFRRRMSPSSKLEEHVARYIAAPTGSAVRILDVGAGPLTSLGKTHPDFDVTISATDALSDVYAQLIDETGVEPPVRTQQCEAEHLTGMFGRGEFDVVHMRNALDHTYDPVQAIRQMAVVTKPQGAVVLQHYRNEAEREKYHGLHQWNLSVNAAGRFIISRPRRPWGLETRDVANEVADTLELVSTSDAHDEPEMDFVVFRRRA